MTRSMEAYVLKIRQQIKEVHKRKRGDSDVSQKSKRTRVTIDGDDSHDKADTA